VTATATATLCQFDPDLRGLSVQQITVDGRPASWHRRGQELIIRPALRLHPGQRFTTVVSYAGVPSPVIDPDGARVDPDRGRRPRRLRAERLAELVSVQ